MMRMFRNQGHHKKQVGEIFAFKTRKNIENLQIQKQTSFCLTIKT